MKKEDVPQDNTYLTNSVIRELCYATDEEGNYTTVTSKGWEVKDIALQNSIQLIEERIENARQRVLSGEVSPVLYYMELNKMDVSILAAYAGYWKWRVKRHFKPSVFARLSNRTLEKYAQIFEITISQLKNVNAQQVHED